MRSRDLDQWMWSEALKMLDDASRLQRRFFDMGTFDAGNGAQATPHWEPPVDIYEAGDELWLFYALPGVAVEQIEVGMEGHEFVVRGIRQLPTVAHTSTIRRLELPHGRFEQRVPLSSARFQLVKQLLDRGCLVIGLRRTT